MKGPGIDRSAGALSGSECVPANSCHLWIRLRWSCLSDCRAERSMPVPYSGNKRGRKNPTQHSYHITAQVSSQRPNGPPGRKSVFSTKANVCIWETFRLEKLKNPCYLIVTKRNRKNTESSGGLPKANGKYGNQSDFKSK